MAFPVKPPRPGDLIEAEPIQRLVFALEQFIKVAPPLCLSGDGVIYLGADYKIRDAVTTSPITARAGNTMGSGTANLYTAEGAALTLALGNASITVYNNTGGTVASGVHCLVAMVEGDYRLIEADCSGVS